MITYSVLVMHNRKPVAHCSLHRQTERILPEGTRLYIKDVIPAAIVDYTSFHMETDALVTLAHIVVDHDPQAIIAAMKKAGWSIHAS